MSVGRIVKPHGVRGEVLVELQSDVPGRFDVGQELRLERPGQPTRRLRIASFRPHKGAGLIGFEGHGDRDLVEDFRGALLTVTLDQVPEAPEGFFYYHELVGCRCFDVREGELGEVREVQEDGGGLLLEVHAPKGILLVPFVEPFLAAVDPSGKRIDLQLPEGLIETCASRD